MIDAINDPLLRKDGDINFLKETLYSLKQENKSWEDVFFVSYQEKEIIYEIPKDEFLKKADFYYDDGYGGQEIDKSLMIVGYDWWLERHEYHGSEWWEFKTLPTHPHVLAPENYKPRWQYDRV